VCGGKIVFVLEGGYESEVVGYGVGAVFSALTNSPFVNEARDEFQGQEPNFELRLNEIKKWHGIK
ncbi:MAG: hypothetical protein JNJ43_17295, partial [Anaerolineales bacterium]|nr:hypothetical protein [Anaerolineales bacterium]